MKILDVPGAKIQTRWLAYNCHNSSFLPVIWNLLYFNILFSNCVTSIGIDTLKSTSLFPWMAKTWVKIWFGHQIQLHVYHAVGVYENLVILAPTAWYVHIVEFNDSQVQASTYPMINRGLPNRAPICNTLYPESLS